MAGEKPLLEVGRRVRWWELGPTGEPLDGTVVEAGYNAIRVKWDDGAASGTFTRSDMPRLIVLPKKETP